MKFRTKITILAIETSCDETAAAVVKYQGGQFLVLSNIVSSQIDIHRPYGGVVPEVAARNHAINIIPVIDQAIKQAKISPKQIDRLAVTVGPGLITSLLVGVQTAKTLAAVWQKSLVPVNHLKGHIYSAWLANKPIKFPVLALIVSGGHTELVLLKDQTSLKKIGQTLDDAAGEAFDKVAALLGLGYPGGPEISRLAQKGNPAAFKLPRPMLNRPDFNFSFAGLKTAVLYTLKKLKVKNLETTADLAASFQQAVVEVLVHKIIAAAKKYQVKTVILSGGVAANQLLRQQLAIEAGRLKTDFFVPPIELCTDNAVIIAAAAVFSQPTPWQKIKVDPNLDIS